MYGEGKLERRQSFWIRNVSVILNKLQEGLIQFLICIAFFKSVFCYSIKEWKIRCGVLFCSCFPDDC